MTDKNTPAGRLAPLPAELHPILALSDAHTFAESAIKAYARAVTDAERDAALDALGELARIFTWIVAPLAGKAHGEGAETLVRHWAEQLKDFRRPWVAFHPADFPKEPDRSQQILDSLENVAGMLKRRQARRERRAA